MLSQKVTYAIMVLNELYSVTPNRQGRKMLLKSMLAESCQMDIKLLRRVLQRLFDHQYINYVNNSVVLMCNPSEVTIYHLFYVLHGGIPLGEEIVRYHGLEANSDPRYPKIALMEDDVNRISQRYFERITVASLKNGRKPTANK